MPNAKKYPYVPSGGILVRAIEQLRKNFPAELNAGVLKGLSIAPKNESTILATLKFLGFVGEDGGKTDSAKKVFSQHEDAIFMEELGSVVKEKYAQVFELFGDEVWTLDRDKLIGFFRSNDDTSDVTGKRQAITFETLSALAGHGELPNYSNSKTPTTRDNRGGTARRTKTSRVNYKKKQRGTQVSSELAGNIGLTVRIEINLPAQGDQKTYDAIFQSIRKNLINGA